MTFTVKRVIGDTLLPILVVLKLNGQPLDLSSYTVKWESETESGTSVTSATATGITKHPTQTVTLDSTNNWVRLNRHGYGVGDHVIFATSGSLSGTGLTAAEEYVVVEADDNWFRVSLRSGGLGITIAAAGTGTHTVYRLGGFAYDLTTTEANTARILKAWVTVVDGSSEIATWPDGYGLTVEIQAKGN